MMKSLLPVASVIALALLSGCDGLTPTRPGPDNVIATAYDEGVDRGVLRNGEAAIAYDPDGCQTWILDDGVEGYSGRRFDPVSGLPVCNNRFPPGTVVKEYRTEKSVIADYVPGARQVGN